MADAKKKNWVEQHTRLRRLTEKAFDGARRAGLSLMRASDAYCETYDEEVARGGHQAK